MTRDIPGYEGLYTIDENGKIFSFISNKERKPVLNRKNGYYQVSFKKEGITKTLYVHRLVALAFLGVPEGDCNCINHKNEIKTDNNYKNLEWCTQAYNNKYNGKTQRCCKPLIGTNIVTGEKVQFLSARKAAEFSHANFKNISACCRGKRKSAGGYIWRFA